MKARMDALGDRMKLYESRETERFLMPKLPVVARMDGNTFSKFTRGMDQPYDLRLRAAMLATREREDRDRMNAEAIALVAAATDGEDYPSDSRTTYGDGNSDEDGTYVYGLEESGDGVAKVFASHLGRVGCDRVSAAVVGSGSRSLDRRNDLLNQSADVWGQGHGIR